MQDETFDPYLASDQPAELPADSPLLRWRALRSRMARKVNASRFRYARVPPRRFWADVLTPESAARLRPLK